MSRRIVVLALLAACADPPPPAKPAAPPPPAFTIRVDGVGAVTASTRANLTALRELLGAGGYTVRPINDSGVELHVYDGAEHLFYVVPNDDGSLFNVHVVSGKIPILAHPSWVIGARFRDAAALTDCECWGSHPMCWKDGDHVAIGFTRDCDGLDTREGRDALNGTPIQRAVWSPRAFGVETESDTDDNATTVPDWVPRTDS